MLRSLRTRMCSLRVPCVLATYTYPTHTSGCQRQAWALKAEEEVFIECSLRTRMCSVSVSKKDLPLYKEEDEEEGEQGDSRLLG